jgi:hypothetical protein
MILKKDSMRPTDSVVLEALFETDDGAKLHPSQQVAASTAAWPLFLGVLIGIVCTMSLVAVVIMPPAYVLEWLSVPEPLGERVERALHPGDQWVTLQAKERDASERLKRREAELASANKRLIESEAAAERLKLSEAERANTNKKLIEAETALAKAQDELRVSTSNTVHGIRISDHNSSRLANGTVYVGAFAVRSSGFCETNASSDKADRLSANLHVGQAISVSSSRGKYRIVLTSMGEGACMYDLVKD